MKTVNFKSHIEFVKSDLNLPSTKLVDIVNASRFTFTPSDSVGGVISREKMDSIMQANRCESFGYVSRYIWDTNMEKDAIIAVDFGYLEQPITIKDSPILHFWTCHKRHCQHVNMETDGNGILVTRCKECNTEKSWHCLRCGAWTPYKITSSPRCKVCATGYAEATDEAKWK